MNSPIQTQIGFTQRNPAGTQQSQLVFGRDVDVTWEAVGFGSQGRPDPLDKLTINIVRVANGLTTSRITLTMLASDVDSILTNPNAPALLALKLREVRVCEDTNNDGTADTEKCMVILGSDTYLPAS